MKVIHSINIFCELGIGTSSSSGLAAACINNSNLSSSPSNKQSSSQHLPKNQNSSIDNDNSRDGNCLTSPNESHLSNAQKSPSDSLSSKTETEKTRSGKSRNKEGTLTSVHFMFSSFIFFVY